VQYFAHLGTAIRLTIQIFHNSQWHDAAELELNEPSRGRYGEAKLGYKFDYAVQWMGLDDERSCSLNLPVELIETYRSAPWFTFLDDIIPSGASRRYWINKLGLMGIPSHEQDATLLHHGTIAPVGDLRIKESLPELPVG
jgi:serine/threonine-protein kinase HipA